MYEIAVEDSFDAAHCLPDYEGSCRRLHGHTYKVVAKFRFASIGESGMAMDFRRAKELLRGVIKTMDHQYINDLREFSLLIPTAENIARVIYDLIKLSEPTIYSVSVWETATSCATYFEGV